MSSEFDYGDDDASWVSEAPSLASDKEEEPDEDLAGFELEHCLELDVDDVLQEDDASAEWTAKAFSGTVHLHYDDVDDMLLAKMKQQVAYIKANVTVAENNLQQDDLDRMTEHVKMYNCFAQTAFYQHLLALANKGRPHDGQDGREPVSMREIELVLRLIFALAVHSDTSLDFAVKHPNDYPLISNTLRAFVGGEVRARKILRWLDVMPNHQQHHGSVWDAPFERNRDLQDLEKLVTQANAKIAFEVGKSDLVVDDDKMRNRSSLAAFLGWIVSKGLKSFGPVNNMIGLLPAGHFVGSTVSLAGDSGLKTTKRILKRLCNAEEDEDVDMKGTTLGADRGYEFDEMQKEFAPKHNLETVRTVKRGASLPFKFGKTSYKSVRIQETIPEAGPRTVFLAQRTLENGKKDNLVLYRSGTGRCTMIASTLPQMDGYHWNLIAKNKKDLALWKEKQFVGPYRLKDVLPDCDCIFYTVAQRGPEWFILRLFTFTSTTAAATVRRLNTEHLSSDQVALLHGHLGIVPAVDASAQDPQEVYAEYLEMSVDELASQTKTQLSKILSAFKVKGRSKIKDKIKMAEAILQGPTEEASIQRSEFEEFVRASHLKPRKRTAATAIGTANEAKVLAGLQEFTAGSSIVEFLQPPREAGFAARSEKRHLGTSVDGTCSSEDVKISGEHPAQGTVVEIKTMTNAGTVHEAEQRMVQSIDSCCFGDAKFRKLVWTVGYRIQLLHHATVLKLDHVVFVVAKARSIIYVVLIRFNQPSRDLYEKMLDDYMTQHLLPIYGTNVALPEMSEKNLSQGNYRIEPETVRLNLSLWRALNKAVVENGGPVPELVHLLPRLISWWNACKGMVDVISRYLKNVHVQIGSASPALVLLVRFCLIFGVNSCITTKLLKHGAPLLSGTIPAGFGYRQFKHSIANQLPLKEVFMDLAKNFRLPLIARGGEARHARTHFSPPDARERPNAEIQREELSEFERAYDERKRNRINFFADDELAKKVRLSTNFQHHCIVDRAFFMASDGDDTSATEGGDTSAAATVTPSARKRSKVDRRACVLCGRLCTSRCLICLAPLCNERIEDELSCTERFHHPDSDLVAIFDAKKRQRSLHPS